MGTLLESRDCMDFNRLAKLEDFIKNIVFGIFKSQQDVQIICQIIEKEFKREITKILDEEHFFMKF